MDLFNVIYSTIKVGEHLTGTGSNAPGYNGMFFNLIPNNLAKNNISSNNPPWLQDPEILILKVNGLV